MQSAMGPAVLVVKYFGFPVHPQDQWCDFETEKSDCPEIPPPDPAFVYLEDKIMWCGKRLSVKDWDIDNIGTYYVMILCRG